MRASMLLPPSHLERTSLPATTPRSENLHRPGWKARISCQLLATTAISGHLGQIPNLDQSVVAPRHQGLGVGRNRQALHPSLVRRKHGLLLEAANVPQSHDAVFITGDKSVAVPGKGHAGEGGHLAAKDGAALFFLDIPELDASVA